MLSLEICMSLILFISSTYYLAYSNHIPTQRNTQLCNHSQGQQYLSYSSQTWDIGFNHIRTDCWPPTWVIWDYESHWGDCCRRLGVKAEERYICTIQHFNRIPVLDWQWQYNALLVWIMMVTLKTQGGSDWSWWSKAISCSVSCSMYGKFGRTVGDGIQYYYLHVCCTSD